MKIQGLEWKYTKHWKGVSKDWGPKVIQGKIVALVGWRYRVSEIGYWVSRYVAVVSDDFVFSNEATGFLEERFTLWEIPTAFVDSSDEAYAKAREIVKSWGDK